MSAAQAYISPQAIQDRCLVRHILFKTEELAVTHFNAARPPACQAGDITCERCHGTDNDAHRADEDGLTPRRTPTRPMVGKQGGVRAPRPTGRGSK